MPSLSVMVLLLPPSHCRHQANRNQIEPEERNNENYYYRIYFVMFLFFCSSNIRMTVNGDILPSFRLSANL